MNRIPASLLTLAFLCVLASNELAARADEFPVKEYEQGVSRYFSSLENISAVVNTKDTILETGDPYFRKSVITSIKGHFRAASEFSGKSGLVTRKKWELLRPDGLFNIKEVAINKYVLDFHEKDVVNMRSVNDGESAVLPMLMPVTKNGILLLDLTQNKSNRLKLHFSGYSKKAERDGGGFSLKSSSEPHDYLSTYEFNREWLLTRYINTSQSQKYHSDIKYEYLDFEGRPLPSLITSITKIKGKSGVSTVEFLNYQRFNGGQADFGLAQFGLPEPVTETPPPNRNFLWITLASVAAVIIAVLVRRKINSLEAKAS